MEHAGMVRYEDITEIRRVAAGSFGEVWLATWVSAQVAVKKLGSSANVASLHEPTMWRMFEKEIAFLRSMHHPNLVFFVSDGWLVRRMWFVVWLVG